MIVMTSFADKRKAFDRLYEVLKQIDSELEEAFDEAGRDAIREYDTESTLPETEDAVLFNTRFHLPEQIMTPGRAWTFDSSRKKLTEAEGCTAADYVYAYPPGTSVIVPGERIDAQVIRDIIHMVETGLNMIGVECPPDGIYIQVIKML